ncbi:MarR family transcriptional regulator [Clostridium estertheticum]|uniref:MarR family winged helix-turn-helix transcriptional regulator n=1 Tax=Clostridium estertheticum TaxID=238834 RepID=UPI001C0CA594|nr:MarR family transcriptional regulator [Clostridium estertheticum]MBU3201138.1 MarR family transcriptional regulator [Clostridium estertheticum]WAG66557.1 MarR family transcriptional regulator [Clostridium estertheticum]
MESFKFSLRDVPKREILKDYSSRFPGINIGAVESCISLLRTASDISKILDEHFSKYDISEGKFTILMLLYRQNDYQLSPISLSKKAEVTKGTMTKLIGGLKNQGFIEKIPNSCDKRGYLVRLSSKGLRILEEILPIHYTLIAKIMSGLEDAQLKELTSLLNLLPNNLYDIER